MSDTWTIPDHIERLGRAVELGEMTREDGITELMKHVELSRDGAAEMLANWQTARARYQQFTKRYDALVAELGREGGGGMYMPMLRDDADG